jgi:hypothetical protein
MGIGLRRFTIPRSQRRLSSVIVPVGDTYDSPLTLQVLEARYGIEGLEDGRPGYWCYVAPRASHN